MTVLLSNHEEVRLSSWMVHVGCVFVPGVRSSRAGMSGSLVSQMECMCAVCFYSLFGKAWMEWSKKLC